MTPGLTIKDHLRVLQPNDPDSYYDSRELVPNDLLVDVSHAKIVITNFHAFKLRERIELSKGGRWLLQGRGEELQTLETDGQMLQRVMPDLMGMKKILVLNDEAHHCSREKPGAKDDDEDLKGDGNKEAENRFRKWLIRSQSGTPKVSSIAHSLVSPSEVALSVEPITGREHNLNGSDPAQIRDRKLDGLDFAWGHDLLHEQFVDRGFPFLLRIVHGQRGPVSYPPLTTMSLREQLSGTRLPSYS